MGDNLKQKANEILSATVKEQKKYSNERKLLFFLLENAKEGNSENLQEMIDIFLKIIKLEGESEVYQKLKLSFNELIEQKIRKEDSNGKQRITLFKIRNKDNEEYTFFTRENAKRYIENNAGDFENTEIEVVKNNNIDLENLINSI